MPNQSIDDYLKAQNHTLAELIISAEKWLIELRRWKSELENTDETEAAAALSNVVKAMSQIEQVASQAKAAFMKADAYSSANTLASQL